MKVTSYVPCIVCILIAGAMIFNNKDDWGWLLFLALLVFPGTWANNTNTEEDEED